ncbi:uncharacterized protein LOC129588792 [Paramacrobiotus metropolitanus]|uniref:uncharacterized protein LOC129588792 n=1 Tax=Paramacrobiotus metropolitanus TaxID=2943436 RepID=UPI002445CE53|nr:uncharacterized protein LOC129588792 [Paramacrobiotus metropolitanus]XP_055339151.1 uncharacterized protein LOC129588792 [Paramacrobiotus metropolitanus]
MHLYEGADRLVYELNAVDMEVNGMLQNGHVIDLEEIEGNPPRLIVDFGCPTHTAVSVEYGKLFQCSPRPTDELPRERRDNNPSESSRWNVQALLRASPDQPWKWYPAHVLLARLKVWRCTPWSRLCWTGMSFASCFHTFRFENRHPWRICGAERSSAEKHRLQSTWATYTLFWLWLATAAAVKFLLKVFIKSPQLWTPFNSYIVTAPVLVFMKSCNRNVAQISNFFDFRWIFGEYCCLFVIISNTVHRLPERASPPSLS